MLDLIEPTKRDSPVKPDRAEVRRVRGGRSHGRPRSRRIQVSWLLFALGFVPWVALMVVPEWWRGLPAGVQGAAYLVSMILVVGACNLILEPRDEPPAGSGTMRPRPGRRGSDGLRHPPRPSPPMARRARPFRPFPVAPDGLPPAEKGGRAAAAPISAVSPARAAVAGGAAGSAAGRDGSPAPEPSGWAPLAAVSVVLFVLASVVPVELGSVLGAIGLAGLFLLGLGAMSQQ
jgi:hypothetical protein